ncbi:MAG: hypothetical protein U0Y08_00495 [Bacteroidia bacterium]
MIEIIIALLLALGFNIDKEEFTIVDDRTGEVYGVGSNSTTGGNSEHDPKTFILYQDDDGQYYLVQK